jgi:hypothetical protein
MLSVREPLETAPHGSAFSKLHFLVFAATIDNAIGIVADMLG